MAIIVVRVARKYFTGCIKWGMCLMRSSFCLFHGSMDSTRCCKQSSGTLGSRWRHSDAFTLLSTHSTSSQRCRVRLRYETCPSCGRKNRGHCRRRKESRSNVCMWNGILSSHVHFNNALRAYRPHPSTDTCASTRIPRVALHFFIFLFRPSVMQLWRWHT